QRTLNPVWSPDSKWVAYSSRLRSMYHAIFVSDVETGETRQVTDGLADSVWPAWDASGKYLWFFASTDFGLRSQWLDMTSYDHDENFGLYLAVLKKGEPSPLLPECDEDKGVGSAPSAPGRAGRSGDTASAAHPAAERRPTPSMTHVAEDAVSAGRHKPLSRTPAPTPRAARRAPGASPVSLFLVDADRTPPQAGQGRLNVALRMYLEPKEEFKQIFNEGWRNQRDYLYVPNMHGSDWPKMKEMYGQSLPYVNHRADLNYLLDNMGAEIAIGHSYVRGGDMPTLPRSPGGLLGADFGIDSGRYKITRI